ncbi:MAG TPA: M48 family metallopeptidase [Thermoanaerobaculia bacterium]|nr:M48 family metallopeptidase [Thermoanaerobaculia bacterium]
MDFFEREERAHRATRRLVVLYILGVVGVVLAVNLAVAVVFGGYLTTQRSSMERAALHAQHPGWHWPLPPEATLGVTFLTLAVMGAGTAYKTMSLSRGGAAVAELVGGRPVDPNTKDLKERQLLNVVEEMALASGVRVPTVYILDRERGINAFAAGFHRNEAVIAVTKGAVELLNRDELQGVLGHEFSHILNGDMRLNLRLIGILQGILVLGLIGYFILRAGAWSSVGSSRDRRGSGGAILVFGIALLVIGYIGVFFGKLIKAAVARQRESLADASSVQFTRNPQGLAGALKKIGGLSYGSRLLNPNAEQASHMFFGDGVPRSWFSWFETHPPLIDRIKELEPDFDGTFPKVEWPSDAAGGKPVEMSAEERAGALAGMGRRAAVIAAGAMAEASRSGATATSGAAFAASVGQPSEKHMLYARKLRDSMPSALLEAARDPASARAVVCALLLAKDEETAGKQLGLMADDPALREETLKLRSAVAALAPEARMPLLDLSLPALKRISKEQFAAFKTRVRGLIQADREVELFEYTLYRILLRALDPEFEPQPPRPPQYYSLAALSAPCAVLLSALARAAGSEESAAQSFDAGVARLPELAQKPSFLPQEESSVGKLDHALETLATVSPANKRELIGAAVAAVAADGQVTVEEGELLRAIADRLDCPVPPLLPGEKLPSGGA